MMTFLLAFLGCVLFIVGAGIGNFFKKRAELKASCGGPLTNPDCCVVKKTTSYVCEKEQNN